ncbi:hypothetical protein Tco_0841159 [Tanacetum coccineum]|uniref:Uncharacterized protein n=1 Tax=Tanacetum coccineum TaxID=301880 RepID=A0ABQ5AYA0_9ASTR
MIRSWSGTVVRCRDIWVCPIVNALAGRLLGAHDLGVATPREVVFDGDKTRRDARRVLIKVHGWYWSIKMCTLGDLGFKTEYLRKGYEAVMSISVDDLYDLDVVRSVLKDVFWIGTWWVCMASWAPEVYKKLGGRWGSSVFTDMVSDEPMSHGKFAYWAPNIESMEVNSESNPLERKDAEGHSLDESLENKEHLDVDSNYSANQKQMAVAHDVDRFVQGCLVVVAKEVPLREEIERDSALGFNHKMSRSTSMLKSGFIEQMVDLIRVGVLEELLKFSGHQCKKNMALMEAGYSHQLLHMKS